MIDIEKLADNYCESFYEDGNGSIEEYTFKPIQLLQFAEAYHKAMCEVEASSTEATVLRPPLKRLGERWTLELWREATKDKTWKTIPEKFANAIMDEMERINK